MHRFSLYALAIAVAVFVASLHLFALAHSLYWTYRWLDTPMHILAGLVIGIAISLPLLGRGFRGTGALLTVVGCVLFIGGVWEIIEYEAGISSLEPTFVRDTFKDFINDIIGALAGFIIVRKFYVRD